MLERDTPLGKYVIRARIGEGGMGAVYRAYDTVLRRQVAIKTILADKTANREYLARFRREALAISQLDDPHIVRLLDFVEGNPARGEPPYMVMELLRGEDLQSVIAKGAIAIDRAVDRLLEVCAAVGACHRHGFVHRDLKGTNVFVTEYNAIETAKVLDFGVAKVWNEAAVAEIADVSEVTRRSVAIGTPAYLAPEILRGGAATPATDQYALGILLYSALTGGRKPFEVQKKGEFRDLHLMRAIMKGDHPPPRTYRRDLPEGLEAVIERAIDRDAERRYPSVHALGEALLPWASPRGRLQWTGHFTNAPRAIAVHTQAVPPATVRQARGGAAVDPDRAPAAPASITRPVASGEMRGLVGLDKAKHAATTKTWDHEGGARRPSPALRATASSSATAPSRRLRSSFLVTCALMGAGAIGAGVYLRGTLRRPRSPFFAVAAPAASPPRQAPSTSATSPSPPTAPAAAPATPPPIQPRPAATPPAPAREAPPPTATAAERKMDEPKKHPKPRRDEEPTVDENGIGIPAN